MDIRKSYHLDSKNTIIWFVNFGLYTLRFKLVNQVELLKPHSAGYNKATEKENRNLQEA